MRGLTELHQCLTENTYTTEHAAFRDTGTVNYFVFNPKDSIKDLDALWGFFDGNASPVLSGSEPELLVSPGAFKSAQLCVKSCCRRLFMVTTVWLWVFFFFWKVPVYLQIIGSLSCCVFR